MAAATPSPPEAPAAAPAAPRVDGDSLYEVVNGRAVEKPAMGAYEIELATLLSWYLTSFVRAHQLGKVVVEALFRIDRTTDLQRRPDVAFVSDARWPRNRRAPSEAAWD